MKTDPDTLWPGVSSLIAGNLGLHFPPQRWSDLQRGLTQAAREFRCEDATACAEWLLSTPLSRDQWQALAGHLTIGETYFFREKKAFDALAERILPELIQARRGKEQRLRFWSAACCTGEEAYSMAILLHRLMPDLKDWNITILATDINPHFLRKAAAGNYGSWSFRDAPTWLQDRYFRSLENGRFEIVPEIKKMVTFMALNLAHDIFPSLETDTNAMDIIFCRNVLMYFTADQARKTVGKLHHSLIEGGWLAVSPSEMSQVLFPQFATRQFPGALLYQKDSSATRSEFSWPSTPVVEIPAWQPPMWEPPAPVTPPIQKAPPVVRPAEPPPRPAPSQKTLAAELYHRGEYGEVVTRLQPLLESQPTETWAFPLLARALANQGRLADALAWCDRWIATDKLDPIAHYLRAVVLLEQGQEDLARPALQRAIYLQPHFILAHFTLGNLSRARGRSDEANKHFANALDMLQRLPSGDPLPESDGLTVGRLSEMITAMILVESSTA